MRHAKAEHTGASDFERHLAERGHADAADAGRWLAALGLEPELALVSAAVRTQETWDAVVEGAGWDLDPELVEGLYAAGTQTALDLLREVDDVFVRGITGQKISQGLVVLVPIGGSSKRYSIVIRAIVTNDFMTGHAAMPGKEFLGLPELAAGIAQKFPELEGVFYDITSKPPATVEWL
jgi:hypothetical protein